MALAAGGVFRHPLDRLKEFGVRIMSLPLISMIAAVTLACGTEGESQPNNGVQPSSPSPIIDGLRNLRIDVGEGRRNAVLGDDSVSGEVKTVLSDGVITFAEYESSVLAMAECVTSAGGVFYKTDQPKLNWRGLYTYSTGFPESIPGAQAAVAGCMERHVGLLDLFWKELTNPTEEEEQIAMNDLAECMKSMGLEKEIPELRRRDDFEMLGPKLSEDQRGLYMSCAQRVAAEHALAYFGPDY